VLLFAHLTVQRNQTYHSGLTIWNDTVAKCPDNSRAQNNLGEALLDAGKVADAIGHYEQAVADPSQILPMRTTIWELPWNKPARLQNAIEHYRQVLRIEPDSADAAQQSW